MNFVKDKVAIVTGGCSGIGLAIVTSFIKNNIKGITIADLNPKGSEIVAALSKQYNTNKIIFVETDVTIKGQFERAFIETINTFKHVDILVNSAGILNDAIWEKEIAINLNGTIHGCLLAIHDYMPKYRSGDQAAIINFSSVTGLEGYPHIPIYSATKHAVIGLTRSWGHEKHYVDTKIRVMAICPDATSTPLLDTMVGKNLGSRYEKISQEWDIPEIQTPDDVAGAAMHILDDGKSGSIWLIQSGKYCEVKLPDVEDLKTF